MPYGASLFLYFKNSQVFVERLLRLQIKVTGRSLLNFQD
jgi:hypothetical protein